MTEVVVGAYGKEGGEGGGTSSMAGVGFVVLLLFVLEWDSRPAACKARELSAEWHDHPANQEVISY